MTQQDGTWPDDGETAPLASGSMPASFVPKSTARRAQSTRPLPQRVGAGAQSYPDTSQFPAQPASASAQGGVYSSGAQYWQYQRNQQYADGRQYQQYQPYQHTPAAAPAAAAPRRTHTRKSPKHGFLALLMWLATAGIVGIMAIREIPFGVDGSRWVPLIAGFVPWLAIASALFLLLSLLWHRRLLAVVSLVCLIFQIVWHIGFFVPTTSLSTEAKQAVTQTDASGLPISTDKYARIMTFNTTTGQADVNAIINEVREQHVEVLCLQEMTEGFVQRLEAAGIDSMLPYHIVAELHHGDNGGCNGIWSLSPMQNVSGDLVEVDASRVAAATITLGDSQVRFVSVHPSSPTRGNQGIWGEGLNSLSSLKEYDHTYVLMGDFNATWDHANFRNILGSRFVDSSQQSGGGFHMTYPANSKIPSLIEIDHIVHDKGVVVGDMSTVELSGSDHRALLATLEAQ